MAKKPDINQVDAMISEGKKSADATSSAHLREGLSALMDGESNELELRRLLGELQENPGLADSWRRYHVVRDTLSGEIHRNPAVNLLGAIHARMEAEGDFALPSRQKRNPGKFLRIVGQGAIAASVAAMVLTGVTYLEVADNQANTGAMVARQDNIPELGGDYTPSEFTRVVRMNDAARSRLQQAVYQFSTSPGTSATASGSNFPFESLEPFEPGQQLQDLPENQLSEEQ
jgi:hypothetical protein